MVSRYVTEIGYLIDQGSAEEAYELLKGRGYLSPIAELDREQVIAVMEQAVAAFFANPRHRQVGE